MDASDLAPADCDETGCTRQPAYRVTRLADGSDRWLCALCLAV